ncbi:hypothetical protein BS50DRAFT_469665, partial [Corynespora cassiicola Philippines]
EPTPIGQLWTASWTPSDLTPYTQHCTSRTTFTAGIYKLSEMYPALKDFAPQLKIFYNKQLYPGSWEGIDLHGTERELLKMDMEQIPFAVREYLQRNPKQRHFSLQDGTVFFAPGAIYPLLPLWVEEPEGATVGECEGVFGDLENYSNELKDGAVVGKVSHKAAGKNEVEITIEAFQVKAASGKGRDEL